MKRWSKIFLFFALFATGQKVLAQIAVNGNVYEQDTITPIEAAIVLFSGISEMGDTIVYQFVTDTLGHYSDSIVTGSYRVWAFAEGYATAYLDDSLQFIDGQVQETINFSLYELFHPVRYVAARQFTNDLVRISWSKNDPLIFEDFETGVLNLFSWNNNLSNHPWAIDSTHACMGSYCMKSTCEGEGNGISQIEVSVYVPLEGHMSFFSKISSESPWDMGRFYLDGVKKMECAGEEEWTEHQFDITAGEHVFRWDYVKDASTDLGDDSFYVDNIHFYREDSAKMPRAFQYYDLFRCRFEEDPVVMASHLTDTMFMDMNWNSLPWGKYCWGVSCHYEGNRGNSDTIWSAYLDKDMTTTFALNATTNVGLLPAGATVTLSSHDGQGHDYQALLDANGHLLLPDVYRDAYELRVHLDGYMDYVSDSVVPVFAPTELEIELTEAMPGIDSLYVSSTGYAVWFMEESQNRDLQCFEIMLNEEIVGTTTSFNFQMEVSYLTEGDTCTIQVRPVYLSGACDWKSRQWTYLSCSNFMGSTNGLEWSLQNEGLQLSWNYPEGNFVGSMLYRDGEFLGFTEENTFLDETVELHGEVEYCLRLVYDGPMDGTYCSMSCEECVQTIFPAYCDPPMKLDGTTFYEDNEYHGALISWGERPEPINEWLYYDSGVYKRSLGGDDEPRIFWAIRFEAEDLSDYIGMALQKVSLYDVGAGTYHLWIYVGGDTAPRTLVRSQNMTLTGAQAWHEETISPAFEIPENEPLWIVVGQQGLARPAAASEDMGDADGRWVSLDGETWTDMHTFNMHYTWMLRAFVTNQAGREMALSKDGYILQQYNLYRSFDNTEYQQIASVPAVEGQLYYEYRDNLADNDHEDVYYRLTAFYLADNGETCESDFATTLNDSGQNYVVIDLTSTNENQTLDFKLYPNPTRDRLRVESDGMQHYSVYNALGQRMLSDNTTADAVDIDLSNCPNGIYLLKVEAGNVVLSRRFVVSR